MDNSRLTETAYLAAIGYVIGTGIVPVTEMPRLAKALRRILARRPHTLEQSGYADDTVNLVGLFLLTGELKLQDEEYSLAATLEEDLRDRPLKSIFLITLCALALPPRVSQLIQPVALSAPSTGELAAVALLVKKDTEAAHRLFPWAQPNSLAVVAERVCLGELEAQPDLDTMVVLSALESSHNFLLLADSTVSATNAEADSPMIKILFLGIQPKDDRRLRIDQEIRNIKERLKRSTLREQFDIQQEWAVRASDLQAHLLEHQPHILHISGHGDESGQIILENEAGNSAPVAQKALTELFKLFVPPLKCVVLNTCFSRIQAEAIARHVDCVIGMTEEIDDDAAIVFASSFYQAIGYGRAVSVAFALGTNQISLHGLLGADIPELIVKPGIDAAQVILPNP